MASTKKNPIIEKIKEEFPKKLQSLYSVTPEEASDKQVYQVLSSIVVDILGNKRQSFINHTHSVGGKQVYYLSMEFLMGRSLKTSLYNLEIADEVRVEQAEERHREEIEAQQEFANAMTKVVDDDEDDF